VIPVEVLVAALASGDTVEIPTARDVETTATSARRCPRLSEETADLR